MAIFQTDVPNFRFSDIDILRAKERLALVLMHYSNQHPSDKLSWEIAKKRLDEYFLLLDHIRKQYFMEGEDAPR